MSLDMICISEGATNFHPSISIRANGITSHYSGQPRTVTSSYKYSVCGTEERRNCDELSCLSNVTASRPRFQNECPFKMLVVVASDLRKSSNKIAYPERNRMEKKLMVIVKSVKCWKALSLDVKLKLP